MGSLPFAHTVQARVGLACFAEGLGGLEVDGDELGDAALGHGDTKQPVHACHRHRVVSDHQEACRCFSGHRLHQRAEAVDVGVIERRIDFVEYADR